MATISGKYLLKRQISLLADTQNVLFTSNSVPYTQMSVTRSPYLTVFTYYNSTTEVSSGVYTWFNEVTGEGSWNNTEYQILDFGSSAQTVSNTFSSWLSNNAYPIASTEYILRVNDVQTSEYQGQLVRCIIKNGTAYRIKDAEGGFEVTISNGVDKTGNCFYSLDDGITWVDIGDSDRTYIDLTDVTQIMFKADDPDISDWGLIRSTQLGLNLNGENGPNFSQNYIITQDITDVEAWTHYD